jgi:hypothetical protein
MRRRNALVIGTALAGLGYSLVRHYNVPADAPESGAQPVPLQVVEPVKEKTPRARPETTESPRARTTRTPRTSAARPRPARPKKAKA